MNSTIAFVGGGNMATSLISGLRSADCPGSHITVIEPDEDKRVQLAEQYGVNTAPSAHGGSLLTDVIVLAVKPQMMSEVAQDLIAPIGDNKPLVLSIAAGVTIASLRQWLGNGHAYVRCMPNTPALIGAGATGLYADEAVTDAQREQAETILASAGATAWVDEESLLDAVTATSGSGPAYFFAFMEAMQAGAVELGLDADTARQLVLNTALGAARMALESGDDPGMLRAKVTSPGGTTAAALEQLSEGGLDALVQRAMQAAAQRAQELGRELQED